MKIKTQEQLADYFSQLKVRSGLSWPEIAKECGYKGQSSMQRFYTPGGSAPHKNYLPTNIIHALLKIMPGLGKPPITKEDILVMADNPFDIPLTDIHTDQPDQMTFLNPLRLAQDAQPKIAVLGYASGSNEKNAINWDLDEPIDWVDPLPNMANIKKAVALYIQGESMSPRYRHGETVFVNMAKQPAMGQDCVLQFDDGTTHIKRFLRMDEKFIYLEQLNPIKDLIVECEKVIGIYAVEGRM